MDDPYPRDLVGYGRTPPDPEWPGGARLAVQFVVNYEEGGENTVLNGDAHSETFLSETPGGSPVVGARNINTETMYEYGSRAGFWRLMRLFEQRGIHFTCYAVGLAIEKHPDAAIAMHEAGHELATHGWRWIDYQHVDEATEREHMKLAIAAHEKIVGERPLGWYGGRVSPITRRLVVEDGGFLYDADAYNDDLPYFTQVGETRHLIVPYSFTYNDARYVLPQGYGSPSDFFESCKRGLDELWAEGEAGYPKMMSIGLHPRIAGQAGRTSGLREFIEYALDKGGVWITRRIDIARWWLEHHQEFQR